MNTIGREDRSVRFMFLLISGLLCVALGAGAGELPGRVVDEPGGSGWENDIVDFLRHKEYSVSWQQSDAVPGVEAGYMAPNRAQGLRFVFQEDGLRVTSRVSPTWVFGLRINKASADGRSPAAGSEVLVVDGNQVSFSGSGIRQTMTNRPTGLELAVHVFDPPAEGGGLPLSLGLSGDVGFRIVRPDMVEVRHANEAIVRIGWLTAVDALDNQLPVVFGRRQSGAIAVEIDAERAVFPVRFGAAVKSISNSEDFYSWTGLNGHYFGYSAATAGDVNKDGYSDVVVGVPGYDQGAGLNSGVVHVCYGSASGPGSPMVDCSYLEGPAAHSGFGSSVATAGDVNGDGYSDIIVGAPEFDVSGSNSNEGGVWVFHGSAAGIVLSAAWSSAGDQVDAFRGSCVATAGDVNGDGYSDIVFSEPNFDSNFDDDVGRVFVFRGSPTGVSSATFVPTGSNEGDYFGQSVSTAGDVNGDGYADLLVAAPWADFGGFMDSGEVRVYYGSASGLDYGSYTTLSQTVSYLRLGLQVSTAGDVNGDGYADAIIGSAGSVMDEGAAFLYRGSASGINTNYLWSAEGTSGGEAFGMDVATAGDVNGDGYSDVMLGATGAGTGACGYAFVWVGSSVGLGPNGTSSNAYWSREGFVSVGASFGSVVATAGDVNGDGYSDILVTDPAYDPNHVGYLAGFYGGPDNLAEDPAWTRDSGQASAQLGVSVATAGDVNGDGFADFIVGAEWFDYTFTDEGAAFAWHGGANSPGWSDPDWSAYGGRDDARFGHSVSTAGDVNGDGYSDVIIGAPGWSNPTADEGGVFVFTGGSSGLAGTSTATAAWKAEIDDFIALFGWSVGTGGDVNGDGFADVVVGAPGAGPSDEGKAFVWHGSAAGLGPNGTGNNADWDWIGSTAYGSFGQSVGTAGDVNRDGFADLVAGGDEIAVVWHGSSTGLDPSTPAWSYASSGFDDNDLGWSVGTAGDTNGDGYSEIVVGAPKMDASSFSADNGAVLVFCGSASGLGGSACFTDLGESDGFGLGYSVATAGDLNGDGLSDVVAGSRYYTNGQPWEGAVRVYYGGIFGLSGWGWHFENNEPYSYLGSSVGSAGDVNGDGFADLLLGAPGFEATYGGEGRVYLFYGNDEHGGGAGGRDRVTQHLSPGGQPIAPLGVSNSETGIRLYYRLPTPSTGRGNLRFQTELKGFDWAFDGQNLSTTWAFDSGVAGYASFTDITWLLAGFRYHWRTRVLHSPVTNPFDPPHGPWFHMACFGENEAHVRSAGGGAPQPEHIFSDGFESGASGIGPHTRDREPVATRVQPAGFAARCGCQRPGPGPLRARWRTRRWCNRTRWCSRRAKNSAVSLTVLRPRQQRAWRLLHPRPRR